MIDSSILSNAFTIFVTKSYDLYQTNLAKSQLLSYRYDYNIHQNYVIINCTDKLNEDFVILYHSIINNICEDKAEYITYTLKDKVSIEDDLKSVALLSNGKITLKTDFWGIQNFYYTRTDNSFCCSNNIFLLSHHVNLEISYHSIYEYLFFLAPRYENTFFKEIRCLLPGQKLTYDVAADKMILSEGTDFKELFHLTKTLDYVKEFETFFQYRKDILDKRSTYLSLSFGTDSRTILSGLKSIGCKHTARTFGTSKNTEVYRLTKLTRKYGINWQFIDISEFEEDFETSYYQGTVISNGLLNPLRTHYITYYKSLHAGDCLFEGILGSEFVKGELADAMISPLHAAVITGKASIEKAVENYYPELPSEIRTSLSEYISQNYSDELSDVNAPKGFTSLYTYLFDVVPRKIFGGVICVLLNKKIDLFFPFLDARFLNALYSQNLGLSNRVSLRKDFAGSISCLKEEANIVLRLYPQIANEILNRNISFRDVLRPYPIVYVKNKLMNQYSKAKYRNMFNSQIDNRKIREIIKETLLRDTSGAVFEVNNHHSHLLNKAMLNLQEIKLIVSAFQDNNV